jgi:hypothetical protein
VTAGLFLKAAWAFLRGLPWQLYAILALVLITAALRWHWIGVGADGVQARWDAQEAVYAQQRAAATIAARNTEARHRAEYKAIADRFLADQDKADADHKATIAGLRAGTLRVRQRFTCPGVPQGPADTGSPDGAGPRGFTSDDAAMALGIAQRADDYARRLNALQDAVRAR